VVSSWPDCWTSLQWDYFRKTYTFLLCEGGKLGCRICQTVQTLGPNGSSEGSSTKRNLAYEWVNVKIDGAGNTKSARQKSLREKVRLHGESDAHKDAEKILSTHSKHFMQQTVIQQQAANLDSTCVVFRTAYFLAKCDRPYVDHPQLLDLQHLNGVNVGKVLQSNVVCAEIIDHIAESMKSRVITAIVQKNIPISVLIDESTTLSHKSALIVYLRCSLDDGSDPVSFFLDLIELSDVTSAGILKALLECLFSHGLRPTWKITG